MAKSKTRMKHDFAGYGLTAVGVACNTLVMNESVKNNSKLNTAVTAVGIAASVGSIVHFMGSLDIYDESEDDSEDKVYLSHLFSIVVCPVVDIYCLANSLKK